MLILFSMSESIKQVTPTPSKLNEANWRARKAELNQKYFARWVAAQAEKASQAVHAQHAARIPKPRSAFRIEEIPPRPLSPKDIEAKNRAQAAKHTDLHRAVQAEGIAAKRLGQNNFRSLETNGPVLFHLVTDASSKLIRTNATGVLAKDDRNITIQKELDQALNPVAVQLRAALREDYFASMRDKTKASDTKASDKVLAAEKQILTELAASEFGVSPELVQLIASHEIANLEREDAQAAGPDGCHQDDNGLHYHLDGYQAPEFVERELQLSNGSNLKLEYDPKTDTLKAAVINPSTEETVSVVHRFTEVKEGTEEGITVQPANIQHIKAGDVLLNVNRTPSLSAEEDLAGISAIIRPLIAKLKGIGILPKGVYPPGDESLDLRDAVFAEGQKAAGHLVSQLAFALNQEGQNVEDALSPRSGKYGLFDLINILAQLAPSAGTTKGTFDVSTSEAFRAPMRTIVELAASAREEEASAGKKVNLDIPVRDANGRNMGSLTVAVDFAKAPAIGNGPNAKHITVEFKPDAALVEAKDHFAANGFKIEFDNEKGQLGGEIAVEKAVAMNLKEHARLQQETV